MLIKVKVKAGAKNESVRKLSEDRFEIAVRENPEQNLANRRVIALIARQFQVTLHKVRLTSGHHRPSKILSIDD